jgi:hypothetical protein
MIAHPLPDSRGFGSRASAIGCRANNNVAAFSSIMARTTHPLKFSGHPADMRSVQDRRSESRMLCADMLEVHWKDETGKDRQAMALLEDISPSGACLHLEIPIPNDTQIHLEFPKQKCSGTTRYCVYREIGYFVGVEFEPGFEWSKKTYRPQHLLDLQHFMAPGKG